MPHKKGTGFGITMTGVNSGLLLGMLINQLMNIILTQAELTSYGWRLPFIFGGALCLISYKIRKTLQETNAFQRIHDKPDFPLAFLFKNHSKQLLAGITSTAIMSGLVVAAIVFMPTYLHEVIKVDSKTISHIMPIAMLFNVITIYFAGKIANRVTAYAILKYLLVATIILTPISYWLISGNFIIHGVIILGILEGVAAMIIPLLITSLFPAKIRLTGVAMSYNIGFTIFGGLAPIIISSLIKAKISGIYTTPTIYLMAISIIASIGLVFARNYSTENIK